MNYPLISIILPCRNEEVFISKCMDSLLANDYPKQKIELFVVDGLSTDNTLGKVKAYLPFFPSIKIISNQKKIFPSAVNIGVSLSKGDFIFIMGAHATYSSDYISKCVESSLQNNADNVGGVMVTNSTENSIMGGLITAALSSPFGVGNSKFRTGSNKIIETDTVFGGCYKREVFLKHGLFNEKLVSTSDYEFNSRIKKSGAKIILVPDIKITYFTRSTLIKFLKNNVRNGFWAIYPIALTDHFPVSMRHLVPLAFLLSLVSTLAISLIWNIFFVVFFIILAIYFLTSFVYSIKSVAQNKFYIVFLPILFFSLHFTYGIGSLQGVFKVALYKISIISHSKKNSVF